MATTQPPAWWQMTLEQRDAWTREQRNKESAEYEAERVKQDAERAERQHRRRERELEESKRYAAEEASEAREELAEAERKLHFYETFLEENAFMKDFEEWKQKRMNAVEEEDGTSPMEQPPQ